MAQDYRLCNQLRGEAVHHCYEEASYLVYSVLRTSRGCTRAADTVCPWTAKSMIATPLPA